MFGCVHLHYKENGQTSVQTTVTTSVAVLFGPGGGVVECIMHSFTHACKFGIARLDACKFARQLEVTFVHILTVIQSLCSFTLLYSLLPLPTL